MLEKQKIKKTIFLLFYVIITCILIFLGKPVYLISIFIILVVPGLVNFFWLKNSKKKILIFSLTATFLFALPLELTARLNDLWNVQSSFPRPFSLIPIEDIIAAFFNFLWVLSFYEYFIDKDQKTKLSPNFKYLLIIFAFLSFFIYGLFFVNKALLEINYLALVLPLIIPLFILLFLKNNYLLKKFIIPTLFFFFVFFLYEIVSILIGSWWWPGEYLYTFVIQEKILPLDDILIWCLLSTPALISGYEFFGDDYK